MVAINSTIFIMMHHAVSHKMIFAVVNLQASNMDALKSKSCVPFSKSCVFTFVARRCSKSSSFSEFL